jgi:hypothetical protein
MANEQVAGVQGIMFAWKSCSSALMRSCVLCDCRIPHKYLMAGACILAFNALWLYALLKDSSARRKAS